MPLLLLLAATAASGLAMVCVVLCAQPRATATK